MQNLVQALLDSQNKTGIGGAHFLTGINGVGKTTFMLNLKKDFDQKKIKVSLSSQKPMMTLKHWKKSMSQLLLKSLVKLLKK